MLVTLRREPIREASRAMAAERAWPLLALLVLVSLGTLYFAARWPLIPLDESMVYVTSAQSLAEGQGYRLIGYLAQPPNTFTPPGYPLALAAIFKLQPDFPANLPLLQLASLLAFYGLLGLGALVLQRCYQASPTEITLAVLLAATTPLALRLSTALMSDSLYGVLALGSILLLRAGWVRPGSQGFKLLAAGALLAVLAYYTRTVGIALVAAMAIDALRRARHGPWWRVALVLLPLLLALPWTAWSALNGATYLRLWGGDVASGDLGGNSLEYVLAVVVRNFILGEEILWVGAPALVSEVVLPGVSAALPLALLASAGLFAFVLWQSGRTWWRGGGLVHLYLLLYLLLLLLWPSRVDGRFLWPVAPLVAWYLVAGLRRGWGYLNGRFGGRGLPVDTVVVAALLLLNVVWLGGVATRVASGEWVIDADQRDTYLAMQRTAEYLRGLEPAHGALSTNHVATTSWWYLYTGRPGVDAIARADSHEPYYVLPPLQGDPEEAIYFVWQRGNGLPGQGVADLPVLQAALAARGADAEPLYCTADRVLCVFDWRRQLAPGPADGSPSPPSERAE